MAKKMTIAKAFKVRANIKKWLNEHSFSQGTGLFVEEVSERNFAHDFPVKNAGSYADDAASVAALKKFYSNRKNPIYDGRTVAEWLARHENVLDDYETINKAIDSANGPVRELLLREAAVQKKLDFYDDIASARKRMSSNYPEEVTEHINIEREPVEEDANGRTKYEKVEVKSKKYCIDVLEDIDFCAKVKELERELIDIRDQITALDNSTFIEVELKEDWA